MITKRNRGFTKTTLPDTPSSGVTAGFDLSFPVDGEAAVAVPVPGLPPPGLASGPAALFKAQPDQSAASRATATNRVTAPDEFGEGTSPGKRVGYAALVNDPVRIPAQRLLPIANRRYSRLKICATANRYLPGAECDAIPRAPGARGGWSA